MRYAEWPLFLDLTQPGFLAILALLPLVVVLGVRSLSSLGPVRRTLAIVLRCAVLVLLTATLSSPEWVRRTDDQTVVFALDQSESVPAALQRAALEFMHSAAAGMRPGKDRAAVVSFAGAPSIEQTPLAQLLIDRVGRPQMPQRTNLAAALRHGLALAPADTARRLVVLSDGNETVGSAAEEAKQCAALGVPIDVVPLRYRYPAEILVESLSAPASARLGEVINLRLVVQSQVSGSARLLLYHNDQLVDLAPDAAGAGLPIELEAGRKRFSVPVMLSSTGVHSFRVTVQPLEDSLDTLPGNNEGRAFTIVGQPQRVLIVTEASERLTEVDDASAELLAEALRDGGIACQRTTVRELPADPAALSDCTAVFLVNVSAFALGAGRQQALATFVRHLGGGLVVIGGDQAFSVGGYARTPLEEVLPVETCRSLVKFLSLALVIVIDRSGSMAGEKIVMARQAAAAAVELLRGRDLVGVVAFNAAPEWLVPLRRADHKAAIIRRLASLGAGGGTVMYPALREALAALVGVDANIKHIIVLTDGQSAGADFDGLARGCAAAGITISTVAVGPDADRDLLGRLAQITGGRMYIADTGHSLPQIFVRETIVASRSGLFEQPFTPHLRPVADSQVLAGFTADSIPPLHGHVITAAKPLAQVPLVRITEDGADPILAYWQAGLGRSVAFTSGLWPRWGPEWVSWAGFSKFWTQVARYADAGSGSAGLQTVTTVKEGRGHLLVSAEHLPSHLRGSLALTGRLIGPDLTVQPLDMQPAGTDRFEASFPVDTPGTYLANLVYRFGGGEAQQSGLLRAGVVVSYAPEYRALRDNEAALIELARITGGRVLDLRQPNAVFETGSVRPVQVRRPIWDVLVRMTVWLFLVDVAIRRIAIRPAEVVARLRQSLRELASPVVAQSSQRLMTTLRQAKNRAWAQSPRPVATPPGSKENTHSQAADRQRAAPRKGVDSARPAESSATPTGSADYMSRLRQAKRRARGNEHDAAD